MLFSGHFCRFDIPCTCSFVAHASKSASLCTPCSDLVGGREHKFENLRIPCSSRVSCDGYKSASRCSLYIDFSRAYVHKFVNHHIPCILSLLESVCTNSRLRKICSYSSSFRACRPAIRHMVCSSASSDRVYRFPSRHIACSDNALYQLRCIWDNVVSSSRAWCCELFSWSSLHVCLV